MINIVLDLSHKLEGFNLYKSFLYNAEAKDKIHFLHNPLVKTKFNLDEIVKDIAAKLGEEKENVWNFTLILDMDKQKEDAMEFSVTNHVKSIKDQIVSRIGKSYRLQRTFVVLLDSVERNGENLIVDKNVVKAIEIDKQGYINCNHDTEREQCLFTNNELDEIDNTWNNLLINKYAKESSMVVNRNELMSEFGSIVCNNYIDKKIQVAKNSDEKNSFERWYGNALEEIKKAFAIEYERIVKSNENDIYNAEKPSLCIKRYLRSYASVSGSEGDAVFKFDYRNMTQGSSVDNQYSNLLKVISFLLFLSDEDENVKKVINNNSFTSADADYYQVDMKINKDKLNDMLCSYYRKIKHEFDLMNEKKIANINYVLFQPSELSFNDLGAERKKSHLPGISKFYDANDVNIITKYENDLYDRYCKAVEKTKTRMRDLSTTLRVEKDKSEKFSQRSFTISEANAEIQERQAEIDKLEASIAKCKPSFTYEDKAKVKRKYHKCAIEAIEAAYQKPSLREIALICTSIVVSMLLCCPLLDHFMKYDFTTYMSLIVTALIVALACFVIVLFTTGDKQNEVYKKLSMMKKDNDKSIDKLFEEDKNFVEYVKNIYKTMMNKKYIEGLKNQIIYQSKTDANTGKHIAWLSEHIASCEILMSKLNVLSNSFGGSDAIIELNMSDENYRQRFYCPLSYLDGGSCIIQIGAGAKDTADCDLIPYVEMINFKEEKEYEYE